ncbi:MAG: hypothetical protein SW019_18705 [Actinomycetota bacterium]|nr:hypothetical protein [Actinomycetota bacterium]
MSTRRLFGPLTTIAAVGAIGAGWWLVNDFANPNPAAEVVSAPVASAAEPAGSPPAPAPAAEPAPDVFPVWAEYAADIPLQGRVLTVELTVDGGTAKAYACDNVGIESWLSGTAWDGAVRLADQTGADRLTGQLRGDTVVGTLWIGERSWDFAATQVGAERGGAGDGY